MVKCNLLAGSFFSYQGYPGMSLRGVHGGHPPPHPSLFSITLLSGSWTLFGSNQTLLNSSQTSMNSNHILISGGQILQSSSQISMNSSHTLMDGGQTLMNSRRTLLGRSKTLPAPVHQPRVSPKGQGIVKIQLHLTCDLMSDVHRQVSVANTAGFLRPCFECQFHQDCTCIKLCRGDCGVAQPVTPVCLELSSCS